MKHFYILLFFLFSSYTYAGHSTGNGSCIDDLVHYQNMENKRTDAPLFAESQKWRDKAVEMNVTRDVEKCEEYMKEALRMIKKTKGEYPTE
tara:strand:- start:98 stop:370 length:273 start_codon:yes stop_codon:yes gene_type:complete